MEGHEGVWVFAEQEDGKLADVGLELLSKGRELADTVGTTLCAVLLGDSVKELSKDLIAQGADEVLVAEDKRLAHYTVGPYAKVICDAARAKKPAVMIFGATTVGRDLAPRVASTLTCGLTADCTDLQIGDYEDKDENKIYTKLLYHIRPAFGGNIIATIVCPDTRPQMATVREGVMRLPTPEPGRKGKVTRITAQLAPEQMVVELLRRETRERKVNLKAANIIVSGGAGVGSRENFRLLFDLAHAIGASVGASRSAVDQGFIDHDHQVGQTGTTVRPKLYIACGISGAVQHRAGMHESSKIIAVNTDPEAPIFDIAHYAIVGDLNEVVPMMIKAYREK